MKLGHRLRLFGALLLLSSGQAQATAVSLNMSSNSPQGSDLVRALVDGFCAVAEISRGTGSRTCRVLVVFSCILREM